VRTIKHAHMLGFLDRDLPKRSESSAKSQQESAASLVR